MRVLELDVLGTGGVFCSLLISSRVTDVINPVFNRQKDGSK